MSLPSASGGHGVHVLADGVGVLLAVTVMAVQLARQRPGAGTGRGTGVLRRTAGLPGTVAAASLGAALIHAAVTPEHVREGAVLGAFFLLCTALQLGFAAAVLLRPGVAVLYAGLVGNAAVAGLWVWTRTAGVPFGVGGGEVEAVGGPDVLANLLGLTAAVGAGLLLAARAGRPVPRLAVTGPQAAYGLILLATAAAVASTASLA